MSDQIPFHIQEEIMTRLPVKSLVQFRCVSKAWKSLIDSSEFIAAHSLRRHTQPHYLLVSYENRGREDDFVTFSNCYIDDDTFPQQTSVPILPSSAKQLIRPIVVGSSQGLLCLHGYNPIFEAHMAILWNPSIRKSVVVHIPVKPIFCLFTGYPYEPSVGFGVCPVTKDPKIVAITHLSQVMVYTLSSRNWRSLSVNLLTKPNQGSNYFVVTDRFIYWDVQLQALKMIMSFDLTTESFEMIDLPDTLARHDHPWLIRISKLRDSLALLQYDEHYNSSVIWMMEVGARKSFTKLFTITTPHLSVVGFRKNGIPFMAVADDDDYDNEDDGDIESIKLVVDDSKLEHNNVLLICDMYYTFYVHSYMETLLLLGRSDYTPC